MKKSCKACRADLNNNVKFCTQCGTKVTLDSKEEKETSENVKTLTEQTKKLSEQAKTKPKSTAKQFIKDSLSNSVSANSSSGEFSLPMNMPMNPPNLSNLADIQNVKGVFSTLKGGLLSFIDGFKKIFQDKKRLIIIIALAVIWLVINILSVFEIFPLPLRFITWLTAAGGSLIGGSIGKGLVGALFVQLFANKNIYQGLKAGFGQIKSTFKGDKKTYSPLLMGAGVSLIFSNLMVNSTFQNTMVSIAAFALSLKAMSGNGFLRQLISSILPKVNNAGITSLMSGWTLGFAVFIAISFVPGRNNGYIFGAVLIVAGIITLFVFKDKKEVQS